MKRSRRAFLLQSAAAALASGAAPGLNSRWQFRLDGSSRWRDVNVPHTWQTDAATAGYLGVAWYQREFDAPSWWSGRTVRIGFEGVTHSAVVSLNGREVGRHDGKGYTAFTVDTAGALKPGERNTVLVRVDNSFRPGVLPRNDSYDWTPDGGIIRPVNLLVTPPVYLERIDVDSDPDLAGGAASVSARLSVRNDTGGPARIVPVVDVVDLTTGLTVLTRRGREADVPPRSGIEVEIPRSTLAAPRLWHFDHPHLYRLDARLEGGSEHRASAVFGIRKIEVRDAGFYLNGERVWLMGVERMAGSHPSYGMAEPSRWIEHDHDDMRELNCVYTRVHWQQDRRVLDYCDRHGLLIQEEVPAWGPKTFEGMKDQPSPEILRNGLEQLGEMIRRDRNHPSVFSWGLCNEVNGRNPAARAFVRALFREARRLDPSRPLTYASNSLQTNPGEDVAAEMDYVMWNEYYESWYKGGPADVRRNLKEIQAAFPGKPIVVSEYGYCECAPGREAGDRGRADILRAHTAIYREFDAVAGAVFFSYNDYRTHIGDKGEGVLRQRVHGVVDLYGERKPSFAALRDESSPADRLTVTVENGRARVAVRGRNRLPAYTMRGYSLRVVAAGFGDLPMEQQSRPLDPVEPGREVDVVFDLKDPRPRKVTVDLLRPGGMTARTAVWRSTT